MIIMRSEYNEEERQNMEKISKDRNHEKQSYYVVYVNFSLSQKTTNFTCVVVLLLCGIMRRGASYLYRFSTNNLTGADFSWGSNIIYFIFCIACFSPQGLHCSSRVCMIDYNKFISHRRQNTRTIRISSEVAQTPTLPLNKEGILWSSSASRSSRFHLYIYIVSIISKRTEGCLCEFVLSECVRENILATYPSLLPMEYFHTWPRDPG